LKNDNLINEKVKVMKLKYILPAALFTGSFLFTSCVKDLEVDNINPQ